MGGRGAMSASGGMSGMEKQHLVSATVKNERPAKGDILRDFIIAKIQSVVEYPELEGQIYNELKSVAMGEISGSIAGLYSPASKKITIDTRLTVRGRRETVAHELAHALAVKPPKGFRSDYEAVASAFREFKKTHPRASAKSFAANVSNYATTSYGEAFAEAFMDVSVNGKKANAVSKSILEHWKG